MKAKLKPWNELADSYGPVETIGDREVLIINQERLFADFYKLNKEKVLDVKPIGATVVCLKGAKDVRIPYYALEILPKETPAAPEIITKEDSMDKDLRELEPAELLDTYEAALAKMAEFAEGVKAIRAELERRMKDEN